ncbi:hypothetical protein ACFVV7_01380 [Streptomyces globisporus]|uniref:hypothetical protein n=1 Tax=Streptomyces globisporus TaxID=1908 RepID=UPI0036DC2721
MRALGRAVADPAAHLIAVTGGTAAELPGIAAERTGSFHRTAPLSAHAAGCAVLVVPSLLPVDPARGRAFARSLEEVDLGVLSDCLRRPGASGS